MRLTAALLQAYRDALYVVHGASGALQIHLGHAQTELDGRVRSGEVWALVQAGNPRSGVWPDALNRVRTLRLQRLLRQAGVAVSPAESQDANGEWHERGWLAHSLPEHRAHAFALRFGQHAVVLGGPGRVATLRHYGVLAQASPA